MTKKTYICLFTVLTKGIFTWITAVTVFLLAETALDRRSIFMTPPDTYFDYIAAAVIVYLLFAVAAELTINRT